jgi:hypothetical protein
MLSVTPLFAQDSTSVNSLQKGNWALQFEMYGGFLTFQIREYLGATFSGKYHISDNRALRVGLDIDGASTDFAVESDQKNQDYARETTSDGTNSNHNLNLVLQHLWYLRENNGIHLYTGLGPMIYINTKRVDQTDDLYHESETDFVDDKTVRHSTDKNYFLGLSGSIGVEYFIKQNLGLSFEFQSSVGYDYEIDKYKRTSERADDSDYGFDENSDRTSHGFSYHSNRVKVGLSIYF